MADRSIVEYLSMGGGHRCGYCGSSSTNYSHGMWAHQMTCEDYQDLIDRGWRRSGMYCYKPLMNKMCCPAYTIKSGKRCYKPVMNRICCPRYTIRCAALEFKLKKSQKKVVKHMTRYLTKSEKDVPKADVTLNAKETTSLPNEKHAKIKPMAGLGADPDKPPCRKAKLVRKERKLQKQAANGIVPEMPQSSQVGQQSTEKSLEEFLLEYSHHSNPAHKLELKLVRADMKSEEFKSTFKESHKVYQKYQTAIHGDPPSKCTEKQFQRFLVDSPLIHYQGPGAPPMGFGTFHHQYYLDGTLIAVGVLDILLHCISSVYLYYHPDYAFLSLGVYSALQEIYLTQQLHKQAPSIEFYYMGFYIHSCPKMKYKGNYYPSYLVCPETFNWVPIEECTPKLDTSEYSRLDDNSPVPPSTDITSVLILHEHQIIPYRIYLLNKLSASDDDDDDDDDVNDDNRDKIQEYADLAGPVAVTRMALYREHEG